MVNCAKVNIWKKVKDNRGYFSKGCACRSISVLSDSSDNSCFSPTGTGDGRGRSSKREIFVMLLDRKGKGRDLFLHVLFLNCLQAQNNPYIY